jgi:hypothetical protein
MKLLQRLAGVGADLSTRKTLKAALKILGIKPENIDKLYIELKNSINEDIFRDLHPRDKMVFIPQCLRNSRKCRAKLTGLGYKCKECCRCKARRIREKAEFLGYRVFVVPGDSMVFNIVKRFRPKAVFGVGCIKELVIAFEEIGIPARTVELSRDGCINTDVDMVRIFDVL